MLRAELLALVSTTSAKVAAAVAVCGLLASQLAFVTLLPAIVRGDIGAAEGASEGLSGFDLTSPATQLDALSPLGASLSGGSVGVALLAIVLFGVLAGTSDFRYGGIVGAALAAPQRWRIVAAKAGAATLAALVLGAGLAIVGGAVLLVTLAASGVPFVVDPAAAAAVIGRGIVTVACLVLIGLAVGLLARSQLAGVLIVLAAILAEPVVTAITQLVSGGTALWTQLLPVSLAHATIGATPALLTPPVAGAVLLGLAAAALGAATLAVQRRDI